MKAYSEHFNLPTSSKEARKLRMQEKCSHGDFETIHANPARLDKWLVRCIACKKVVASELSTGDGVQENEIVI